MAGVAAAVLSRALGPRGDRFLQVCPFSNIKSSGVIHPAFAFVWFVCFFLSLLFGPLCLSCNCARFLYFTISFYLCGLLRLSFVCLSLCAFVFRFIRLSRSSVFCTVNGLRSPSGALAAPAHPKADRDIKRYPHTSTTFCLCIGVLLNINSTSSAFAAAVCLCTHHPTTLSRPSSVKNNHGALPRWVADPYGLERGRQIRVWLLEKQYFRAVFYNPGVGRRTGLCIIVVNKRVQLRFARNSHHFWPPSVALVNVRHHALVRQ